MKKDNQDIDEEQIVEDEVVEEVTEAVVDDGPPEGPRVFLTKSEILAAEDMLHEDMYVKDWGGWVRIQGLTGTQRDRYESSLFQSAKKGTKPDLRNIRAKLVSMCAHDGEGKRLFSFNDVEKLGKKSAKALDKLFAKAQELSGLREKDVEELQKNLESVHNEDSNLD